ncbi:gp436 family protein [Martelella mediterranea]|uniref:Phage gp36-like protein n=1 Tax=Martelella mediterranea TaxID=293089 RepID=A0A4R3NXK9_9HYPH|nr:DUF1320 domain-containing protein [Martelella mediterranea]TCT37696.1 phage gp36-like protein [Martelella mediterranea]
MYGALDDLIDRAGEVEILQVADRDGNGAADPDVIDAAFAHAGNIIDGYLAGKYTLPLASVPDLVRTWAVSIARYRLHHEGPPDYVVNDYKDAIAALKDVARGAITLTIADGSTPDASANGGDYLNADAPTSHAGAILKGWNNA